MPIMERVEGGGRERVEKKENYERMWILKREGRVNTDMFGRPHLHTKKYIDVFFITHILHSSYYTFALDLMQQSLVKAWKGYCLNRSTTKPISNKMMLKFFKV